MKEKLDLIILMIISDLIVFLQVGMFANCHYSFYFVFIVSVTIIYKH